MLRVLVGTSEYGPISHVVQFLSVFDQIRNRRISRFFSDVVRVSVGLRPLSDVECAVFSDIWRRCGSAKGKRFLRRLVRRCGANVSRILLVSPHWETPDPSLPRWTRARGPFMSQVDIPIESILPLRNSVDPKRFSRLVSSIAWSWYCTMSICSNSPQGGFFRGFYRRRLTQFHWYSSRVFETREGRRFGDVLPTIGCRIRKTEFTLSSSLSRWDASQVDLALERIDDGETPLLCYEAWVCWLKGSFDQLSDPIVHLLHQFSPAAMHLSPEAVMKVLKTPGGPNAYLRLSRQLQGKYPTMISRSRGITTLMCCSRDSEPLVLFELLKQPRQRVLACDERGRTALHWAFSGDYSYMRGISWPFREKIYALLRHEPRLLRMKSNNGEIPAVMFQRRPLGRMDVLLHKKFSFLNVFSSCSCRAMSPFLMKLSRCQHSGREKLLKQFLSMIDKGMSLQDLGPAVAWCLARSMIIHGDFLGMAVLIREGVSKDLHNDRGVSLLIMACSRMRIELVEWLLSDEVRVNPRHTMKNGQTVLHCLARMDPREHFARSKTVCLVKILTRFDPDLLSFEDNEGNTPAQVAEEQGNRLVLDAIKSI